MANIDDTNGNRQMMLDLGCNLKVLLRFSGFVVLGVVYYMKVI